MDQPLYYLVMHLPHTDADQKRFLEGVRVGMGAAMARQEAKTEGGKNVGARWAWAPVLRAGDMNMTEHLLDNEKGVHTPGPSVVEAMRNLDAELGCGADVYRTMEPNGSGFTHGKEGQGRRLDTFGAPPEWLQGPTGVVAHRELSPRATAYSYVDTITGREVYKESDHALIQVTLRVSKIVKPPPKPTITLGALRSPEVRKVTDAVLARGDSQGGARAASPPLQGLAPPARRPRAAGAPWEARARAARVQTAGEDLVWWWWWWWWCAHLTSDYLRQASQDRGKYITPYSSYDDDNII